MATNIVIPDAKPAYELIDGQLVQKMSSKTRHALLQQAIAATLGAWAGEALAVGTEWRFRIADGAQRHALVPDVACVARERLLAVPRGEAREEPPFAPDIAVEILSPGDDQGLLNLKIGAYLRTGARLVLIVDPLDRTMRAHDPERTSVWDQHAVFAHELFPGLRIDLAALFSLIDRYS